MTLWVVRAGRQGEQEQGALEHSVITIGWSLPDLSDINDVEQLRKVYVENHPGETKNQVANNHSQVWRFIHDIARGDTVVIPLKTQPQVVVGLVEGDYEYSHLADNIQHVRRVKWVGIVPKSNVPADVFQAVSTPNTVSKITNAAAIEFFSGERAHRTTDLIHAFVRVAQKIERRELKLWHIDFEGQMDARSFLKQKLDEFLENPTAERFSGFWKKPYIYAAMMKSSAQTLLNNNEVDRIAAVLAEIKGTDHYDPNWESQLGSFGALREFWGKVKDQPVQNGCADNALAFFGYKKAPSYEHFVRTFSTFARFYQQIVGSETATSYPREVELDQLFNFIDKARCDDLVSHPELEEEKEIKALYDIALDCQQPPSPLRYWVEMRHEHDYDVKDVNFAFGKGLVSPQTSADGKDIYRLIRQVRAGDVVFHLLVDKHAFVGISVVDRAVDDTFVAPADLDFAGQPGYLVQLRDFQELETPITKDDLFSDTSTVAELLKIESKYKGKVPLFYNKGLYFNQGAYLTEAPSELVELLSGIYKRKTTHDLPHVEPPPELNRQVILAYSSAAKKAADGTLTFGYLDFDARERQIAKLKQLFKTFLDQPTEENLKAFWNTDYLELTVGGATIGHLLQKEKNVDIAKIHDQLAELKRADAFSEEWETTLRSHWPLWELWGKIKDKPLVSFGWTGLSFFGYENPVPSYAGFLRNYEDFLAFYSEVVGKDRVTAYRSEIEINELFAFIYAVKRQNIGNEVRSLGDPDVRRLFDLIRESPGAQSRSWIFQANPERFDLLGALKPGGDIAWAINQNRGDVTVGDTVYYWMSGPNAGIYGVGSIATPPTKDIDTFGEWGVETKVERVFVKNYVSKEQYVEHPVLAESRIIRQPHMTNFRLSSDESIAVEALIPRNELSELTGVPRHIQSILGRKSQVILYGPPGTGKTYWAMTTALALSSRSKFGVDFDSLSYEQKSRIQKGNSSCGALVRMCSFHPSYGYEEFLEGYRPHTKNDELTFELENGMFKELCLDATKHPDNDFFLIIDEINRGDIPRIFGELLTILEKDKRGQEIVLPFSKKRFSVPASAYVIGTMNTADRSIALLDTALRRRFGFIELMPDARTLGGVVVEGIELAQLLDALNKKILEHLGQTARDLQIGHSYLLKDGQPITDFVSLSRAVQEDIIPLLQEYCYENFTTLKKILGGALIDAKRQKINAELFDPSQEERLIEALRAIVSEKAMPPVETYDEEESSDDENEGEE